MEDVCIWLKHIATNASQEKIVKIGKSTRAPRYMRMKRMAQKKWRKFSWRWLLALVVIFLALLVPGIIATESSRREKMERLKEAKKQYDKQKLEKDSLQDSLRQAHQEREKMRAQSEEQQRKAEKTAKAVSVNQEASRKKMQEMEAERQAAEEREKV